ncbi:MAG: hypothetical protein PHW13_10905 [Methylococcales bacterium]|nr:hypothetical protein [Methylococcales bacterium]
MRHQIILILGSALLAGLAFNCQAQSYGQTVIPDKVKASILKRHPKAQDLQASPEIHFQRHLLEVSFKEEGSDEPIMELFREDGHLFGNELQLVDLTEAPDAVRESLKTNFPNYTLKKAEMVANPNGNGEEYEVYLVSGGANWKVSVSEKGQIENKAPY